MRYPQTHKSCAVAVSALSHTIQGMGPSARATLIFDGDDTLWRTMPLYTAAKQQFIRQMGKWGFDVIAVEAEFEERDVRNVANWGFTVERFRRSMLETYRLFSEKRGRVIRPPDELRISTFAASVLRRKVRAMPGARAVLERLQGTCRLVLVSKGEPGLQARRVVESRLGQFFERVMIVPGKDRAVFGEIVAELGLRPARSWSIGDSFRSDIKPALEAGLNAIWIPQSTWGYESSGPTGEDGAVVRIDTIRALPTALKEVGALDDISL